MAESKENSKEIKVKSFRIDNETAQKFKDIADGLGTNQQDTMQILINAYCMQEQKTALTDYKADLERIEGYTTAILQMYTTSLQANKDVKETVKADFEASLKSKDAVIQSLQEKLASSNQDRENAVEKAKEIEEIKDKLGKEVHSLQSQLTDKERLIQELTSVNNTYKKDVATLEESTKVNVALKVELENKSTEIAKLQEKLTMSQNEVTMLKQQSKIDIKASVLKVKEEYQAKIEVYQKKYTDLLEQINSNRVSPIIKEKREYVDFSDILKELEKNKEKNE
jgi:predicted RNase H-like nuclease (RuvC/YqgF family)